MTSPKSNYDEMRDTWRDYNGRQEFEHQLIDRKTMWMLVTQGILFAAYGATFDGGAEGGDLDRFRSIVAATGATIAALVGVGVFALIRSKRLSWEQYRNFFDSSDILSLPRPLNSESLQWGVRTSNTWIALVPDYGLPITLILAWGALALLGE